jgi:hypothetical protein
MTAHMQPRYWNFITSSSTFTDYLTDICIAIMPWDAAHVGSFCQHTHVPNTEIPKFDSDDNSNLTPR